MSRPKVGFSQTPNPNALKCSVEGTIPPIAGKAGPRSYSGGSDVSGDDLAASLLAIPGVTHVLIAERWLTVNRKDGADWKPIKAAVQSLLQSHARSPEVAGGGAAS